MELKEYLLNIEEVNTVIYTPKKDLRMKLQLVAPYQRKEFFDFILVLGGSYYISLQIMDGIYLYEFFNVLHKNLYPIQDKKNTSFIIDEAIRGIQKAFPLEASDIIMKRINILLDEIRRYMMGQTLTKVFKSNYEYWYSCFYHRPSKVFVMADLKRSSIQEMHEILSSLEYQKVLGIIYPDALASDDNAPSYLNDKKCFYNTLKSDGTIPLSGLLRLYEAGLDEIIIPIESLDPILEEKLAGKNIKDLLNLVKLSMQAGLKVSIYTRIRKDNTNYLEMMKTLHQKGIRSFQIEFDPLVEKKDILFRQIYFYASMYSLELKLHTKGILKEKEINKLKVIPSYRENMVSTYYTKGDFVLYADCSLSNRLGSLSMEQIEAVYQSSLAKKLRKESLKRK